MAKRSNSQTPANRTPAKRGRTARQAFNDNSRFEYTISDAQRARALNPPVDNSVVETLHGVRVSDPFRPLENLTAPETAAWIKRQNARFDAHLKPSLPFYNDAVDFMNKGQAKGMAESMPRRLKKGLYTSWRRLENQDRWSLYLKDSADYGAPARKILDPLDLDPSGKTNISGTYFNKNGRILAYTLSVAGSDENTVHFLDMETGQHLPLSYPATRSWRDGIHWDRDGESFTYTRPVAGLEKSFEMLRHRLGTDIAEDDLLYSPKDIETSVSVYRLKRDMTRELGTYEFAYEANNDYMNNRILMRVAGSGEAFKEIFGYGNGNLSPIAEIDGKIYALTSNGAKRKRLVRFDPSNPAPQNWETVIGEHATDLLNNVWTWQGKIFASYTHDTADKVVMFTKDGVKLGEVPLPAMSSATWGQMVPEEDTCLLAIDSYQEDGAIYQYNTTDNTLTLHRASPLPIDLKDCIVERIHAPSKDGTLVPMTVIRQTDTVLDGTAATLLYGYGGFNVSLNPGFATSVAQWVRAGGIYAQANLRGGGEYGQDWYDQGRRENKQNVFDDFAACAEHLIAQKYTSPARLGIEGGSNGGLLTLATGLQRPDLFGAIVSSVPVTDMNRFHIGSYYGFGWKGDYGDPDVKKDFNVAAKYSPYHNVRPGFVHPPIFISTDANDDRVLPWHGYKMAALLQAREAPGCVTVLYIATSGGHGGGGSLKLYNQSAARVHAFLERSLGPISQTAYKASLKAAKPAKKPGNNR